jgi:hypothetical protein
MRKFYLLAWILLAATILGAWQHDNLNPLTILAFSFITFGLFWGFAMWLAFTNDPAATLTNSQIRINKYKE